MSTPVILITDPEQRAALAAARSLGRRGFRVVVQGKSPGLAGRSRFVSAFAQVPAAALADPAAFTSATAETVRQYGVQIVLPVTDAASKALLGHDARIGATVAGPTPEAYARASDKQALLECAAACGIRVPRQRVIVDADAFEAAQVPFHEVVIKPTRSVVEVNGRLVGTKVRMVGHHESLGDAIRSFPAGAYPLLLQERIVGDGVGVFLFRTEGRTHLSFGHRRLREKPPAGGVSTYREAIAPPAALVRKCELLLDELGYNGAAMVEFKEDASGGDWVLMEINARLWGSVQLAIDVGVDFPVALVRWAMGQAIEAPAAPALGARSVWELGELDHMIALMRQSRESLQLSADTAIGVRGALRVLFDRRWSDRTEVWRWSDPVPFAAELVRWLRRIN